MVDYSMLAAEFDSEILGEDDSINLGSYDEFCMDFDIPLDDEYAIGEINYYLHMRGLHLEEDHTQVFLQKY